MERIFFLNKDSNEPLYMQLYFSIVKEIEMGRILRHEKMPSVRQLSKTMNISRTTIENTYNQLVAEGYIYSKPQSGYYASDILKFAPMNKGKPMEYIDHETKDVHEEQFDFLSEYVEDAHFDITMWKRNIQRVFNQYERELFHGAGLFGEEPLKKSICDYFGRVRGIRATPSQVVIDAGTQNLLMSISDFFIESGYQSVYVENPGFDVARHVFERQGFDIHGIQVRKGAVEISRLSVKPSSLIFTSPSYQFPYGYIMPIGDRQRLIKLAVDSDSYILEDDYNNELRYVGKPIRSLQGMDYHNRVIYLGSFSPLLLPSIRISFMVLPEQLVEAFEKTTLMKTQGASKLEQLALAEMIDSGDFAKHIRRLRNSYKKKSMWVEELIEERLSDYVDFERSGAGIAIILKLKQPIDTVILRNYLKDEKLHIGLMSDYLLEKPKNPLEKYLILNYRGINRDLVIQGIERLRKILCQAY
jgi:GntR family transcriptional regulator/MocR family aminotransferase